MDLTSISKGLSSSEILEEYAFSLASLLPLWKVLKDTWPHIIIEGSNYSTNGAIGELFKIKDN